MWKNTIMTTDRILEIIQRNYDKFTGTNEAELHAAEEIAALFTELRDLLEQLADIQNGPPLIQDEKEWREIMDKTYALLKETE